VDSVVDSLLPEQDQRAGAMRFGQAEPDLECSTNGPPIERPGILVIRSFVFANCSRRIKEVEENETKRIPRAAQARELSAKFSSADPAMALDYEIRAAVL
jgi:hypothetical protein